VKQNAISKRIDSALAVIQRLLQSGSSSTKVSVL
jgi:hypothetical protein